MVPYVLARTIARNLLADNHTLPWGIALRRANLWAMFLVAFCYVYGLYFFISWFHTFLVRGRGFSEGAPSHACQRQIEQEGPAEISAGVRH